VGWRNKPAIVSGTFATRTCNLWRFYSEDSFLFFPHHLSTSFFLSNLLVAWLGIGICISWIFLLSFFSWAMDLVVSLDTLLLESFYTPFSFTPPL